MAALQVFVVEFLVAGSWHGHYGYAADALGELGVPFCGEHGDESCTATAYLMNISFALLGAAFVFGAARQWSRTRAISWPACYAAAGVGMMLAALAHVDRHWQAHTLGIATFCACANFATLGTVTDDLRLGVTRRALAGLLSLLGLTAFLLSVSGWTLGLGHGGIERVACYAGILGFVLTIAGPRGPHSTIGGAV
ncbi:hypothetical protein [Nocardia panacis]|uniref:hypothetical protein n=1 Tax=Nocardia panacis TaxID=2340916 RepID=UPI001315661C|nr:hypothetical protein [Nocardia panacis]